MAKSNYGILAVIILLTSITVYYGQTAKFSIGKDGVSYYQTFAGVSLKTGTEYNSLYYQNPLKKLPKNSTGTKFSIINTSTDFTHEFLAKRTVPWGNLNRINDTWQFNGDIKDLGKFPVLHKIEVMDAKGLIYEYKVTGLIYDGPTTNLPLTQTFASFGKDMQVAWSPGFYYARLTSSGTLTIRYNVTSNYEVFYNRLFDPPVTSVLQDGRQLNRTYDLGMLQFGANGTNMPFMINLTFNSSSNGCIDFDYIINHTCGGTNYSVLLNMTYVNTTEFAGGNRTTNISKNLSGAKIIQSNSSHLLRGGYKITGLADAQGNYPTDIQIDDSVDGIADHIIVGTLKNETIEQTNLIYNSIKTRKTNISYSEAGSELLFSNTSSDLPISNWSMKISAFNDLDSDNVFQYDETFNSTMSFNKTLSYGIAAPLGVFDNFILNISGRWSHVDVGSSDCGTPSFIYATIPSRLETSGSATTACTTHTCNYDMEYSDLIADLRSTSIVNITMFRSFSLVKPSSSNCGPSASNTIYATDGTTQVTLKQWSGSCGGTCSVSSSDFINLSMVRRPADYKTWEVIINGVSDGNKDISSLDFNQQITVKINNVYSVGGDCSGPACTAGYNTYIDKIEWGGLMANNSETNGTYSSTGNFTSKVFMHTNSNLNRILVSANGIGFIPRFRNFRPRSLLKSCNQ